MKISPNAGAAAAVSPSEVKFPITLLATASAPQPLTIYDLGTTPLTVSNVSVSGDFSIQPSSCGTVTASGGSCTIQVTFTPTVIGARVGAVTITDSSPGSPHSVHLIGMGGQALATPSPSSLSFPSQGINTTSSPQLLTITNGGTIDLQLSHIQISAGPFSETNTCGTTIFAGQPCNINVTFAPTNTGTFTGSITITDSAADSPQTVPLSGTGVNSLGLAVPPGASNSATVAAGATASYTLSIGGSGVSGTASLTCTGAPTGAVCSVPPYGFSQRRHCIYFQRQREHRPRTIHSSVRSFSGQIGAGALAMGAGNDRMFISSPRGSTPTSPKIGLPPCAVAGAGTVCLRIGQFQQPHFNTEHSNPKLHAGWNLHPGDHCTVGEFHAEPESNAYDSLVVIASLALVAN